MNTLLNGFSDEICKLAGDVTPSQPVVPDQQSFAGISKQVHSPTGAKALLPKSLGTPATRVGAPPPRTSPPSMLTGDI